ncbi:lipoprotein-releasing ABC transporter permease subunit [Pseudoalteromonas spongiae]|uniref:lipoprotein-releasing ABC transporter permease subunit n=1 Tax=Pseudoalteromonas spongiae TaxID=298657 RepID=UPI0037369216
MFQPVSLFIGMRYAKLAKGNGFISFISFFSIAGITLGIIALICVTSVMNGFENRLKQSMLQITPHLSVALPDRQNHSLYQTLATHPDVTSISRFKSSEGLVVSNTKLLAAKIYGIDDSQDTPLTAMLNSETVKQLANTKYSVAITRRLATELNVSVGDKIRLMLPSVTTFTPVGRMPSQRLFTVAVLLDNSAFHSQVILTSTSNLLRLNRIKPSSFNEFALYLTDPFKLDDLIKDMPELKTLKVADWKDTQGSLFSAVAMEKRIMSLLLGLIILVAVFNILSALTMMVSEKQSEIAILQTLGLTPNGVLQVFMVQGLYNGLVGSVLGVLLGLAVALNINEILALIGIQIIAGMQLPVDVSWLQVGVIFTLSIAMSYLATFYPARRAAKLAPAQVLRYE